MSYTNDDLTAENVFAVIKVKLYQVVGIPFSIIVDCLYNFHFYKSKIFKHANSQK